MLIKKHILRCGAALTAAVAMCGTMAVPAAFAEDYEQPTLNPHVKNIIEQDGYQFIDLNGNGTLDKYEDWRLDAETRADDLVSQMTVREKIAQMQHPTFLPRSDGKIPSYLEKWCNTEGIGMLLIRELNSVEAAATTMNTIQEYAEGSRLGVPVLVSMDSVHGLSYVTGATVTPHNLAVHDAMSVVVARVLVKRLFVSVQYVVERLVADGVYRNGKSLFVRKRDKPVQFRIRVQRNAACVLIVCIRAA